LHCNDDDDIHTHIIYPSHLSSLALPLLLLFLIYCNIASPSLRGITQDVQEEFDSFVEVMEKRKDEKDLLAAYADVLDYYMYPEDSEDYSSENIDSEDYEFEEKKKKKGGKGGSGGGGNMGCAHGYKFRRGAGCVYEGGHHYSGHRAPYYGGSHGRGGSCGPEIKCPYQRKVTAGRDPRGCKIQYCVPR